MTVHEQLVASHAVLDAKEGTNMSTPKLAAKMVLAMKAIDAVAKNGKNSFQNYKYVQAADVAHEVRKALVENGISFDYSVTDTDRWDRQNSKGNTESCVQVKVAVTFTDQDSGESRTVNSIGWGMDSLDKAPYKAMTGAVKYALRMNFLIPDDADPENDSNGNGHQNTQRAQKPVPQLNPDAEEPNDYDVHMQQSAPDYGFEAPPEPRVRKPGPVISEAQAKRFFGIAMGSGKTKAEINNYLAIKGYNTTGEILRSEYEQHCEWAAK
jgi:hypothetical protein